MRSPIAPRTAIRLADRWSRKLLAVSLLALALAGCKTLDDEPGAQVAGWTLVDPTQRHPIMVSQQPATLTLRVAARLAGADAGAAGAGRRRSSSATASADAGNSKLVIAVPSGSPNESAAVRAVGEMRS